MEKTNTFLERLKNPAIWFALISFFFWISIKLYRVDVISDRLDKKIAVQNDMHKEFDDFKLEMIESIHEIELSVKNEKIERLESDIKRLKE